MFFGWRKASEDPLLEDTFNNEEDKNEIDTVEYAPPTSWIADLQVLYAMWFAKITGDTHQERLESFYKKQARFYDSYRDRMLHGRRPMMRKMPAFTGDVWVDFGGGTGSNLEFFGENVANFKKVLLVDLAPSLLEIAQKRVHTNDWTNVQIVTGDVTDPNLPGLPKEGTVDVITISYALTMIPNWKDALENARRLLKPDGHIAVCDFTVDPKSQWSISQYLWKKVFSFDNVFLTKEHIEYLKRAFHCEYHQLEYGTFPYVPSLFKCPYYVFIGRV